MKTTFHPNDPEKVKSVTLDGVPVDLTLCLFVDAEYGYIVTQKLTETNKFVRDEKGRIVLEAIRGEVKVELES